MSSYQEKYLKYKNKYSELKNKKAIYDMIGGKVDFTPTDIDDVMKFIKSHVEPVDGKDYKTDPTPDPTPDPEPYGEKSKLSDKKRYFVICYGPPASGKTLARKMACNIIKNHFGEELPINDLMKTFVDTSVDNIIYHSEAIIKNGEGKTETKKTIKQILIDNINNVFKPNVNILDDTKIQLPDVDKLGLLADTDIRKNFDTQIQLNQNIYFNYKEIADDLSLILGAFGILRKKNIFFEIASPAIEYMLDLISVLYKWKYNIILIYPFTKNIDLLCSRSIRRGCEEGRVVPAAEVTWKASKSIDKYFEDIIEVDNPNSMINKLDNLYVLRYNAEINLEKTIGDKKILDMINEGTYPLNDTSVNEDIYDIIYKKDRTKDITVIKQTQKQ